ncbi:metal-dependent hydrolase [Haloferacaceae archaeon DSL9]
MFPWEHVIFGYVGYSVFCHLVFRDSPGEGEALTVVFVSLLPDVMDKPLAWQFGVFETGYALGHSIFFAIPVSILVGLAARQTGRLRVGIAFAIGYALHLIGDLLPIYFREGTWPIDRLLWPVLVRPSDHTDSLAEQFLEYAVPYLIQIVTLDPSPYLVVQFVIASVTFLLWAYDGFPGVRGTYAALKKPFTTETS